MSCFQFEDCQSVRIFSLNKKEDIESELIKFIDKAYDYVFSHSLCKHNEYGHHDNHEEVGIVASEIAKEKSWGLIRFCYRPIYCSSGVGTVADDKRADYYYQLSYVELRFKLKLIENCFQQEIDRNLANLDYSCPNPEAFKGYDLPKPFIRSNNIL